ncbi:MAG: hypothetical protein GY913_21400, partial [Proteobacteria bacterium]|nr:hypothetical protein [Pseudomonadota bacterium]
MKATAYEGGWTVERLAIVRRPWRVVATPSGDRWLATNENTLDSTGGKCASVFDGWARGYAYVLSTGTIHARPPTTSGAAAALLLVYAAAKADPARWWGRHARADTGAHVIPEGGWLGRWDPEDSWQTLDVLPSALDALLKGSSYDV